ncbi:MAG: hypothetical protein A6F72_01015 [Cycloclasticus sp. symbiont of Poecilosclerida sp. N]|nr:MAG: hypothetical protein A6F72_01015 [Cycloclasticus sp. symbiont of Poecilosclerida sp. N]
MKKLPIGITTFAKIRDEQQNYLYVDKTDIAYKLITSAEYYFLSRPRRFGKSLFLDTLDNIFCANKDLFKGLYIYDKWDWSTKYPVIRIDFNVGDFATVKGIENRVFAILDNISKTLGVTCEVTEDIPRCFNDLIIATYKKHNQKVVILIDEYDKPILDNITNPEIATQARHILRVFYGVIKSCDQYLKFVLMTGVSKFSKLNLFSGLNNIQDITINPQYATICGYTHNDIKTTFIEHLQGVDLEKLKIWYNGYNYFGDPVYNPYDILLFVANGCLYKNYWWETGNPKFLVDLLKQNTYNIPQLENIITTEEILNTFDVEKIDLVALLWQTGYLTFDKYIIKNDFIKYKMRIPNKEIQHALNSLFIDYLTNNVNKRLQYQDALIDSLENDDLSHLQSSLNSLFASISYENYKKNNIANYEGYYASVVFTYFASLGFELIQEDNTNTGRIDLTLKLINKIVIIEFKVDIKEAALTQIKQKKYYQKYLNDSRDIFIVGICFDSKAKNITEFVWEQINNDNQ